MTIPSVETRADPQVTPFPGKYLSLASFRRDGTAVATPVWFVQVDGRLLVETDENSYKVKRIRRNPSVTIAVCTARGRLRGEKYAARAEVLPGSEVDRVEKLMTRKYRADMVFIRPIRAIQSALHLGRPRGKSVIVALEPEE